MTRSMVYTITIVLGSPARATVLRIVSRPFDLRSESTNNHLLDEDAKEGVGRDLDQGFHAVQRLDMLALREVQNCKRLVRDCAEMFVGKTQCRKGLWTGMIDNHGENFVGHSEQ